MTALFSNLPAPATSIYARLHIITSTVYASMYAHITQQIWVKYYLLHLWGMQNYNLSHHSSQPGHAHADIYACMWPCSNCMATCIGIHAAIYCRHQLYVCCPFVLHICSVYILYDHHYVFQLCNVFSVTRVTLCHCQSSINPSPS